MNSRDQRTADHYHQPALAEAIEQAFLASGKSLAQLTVDDLGPVDEFHVGGRAATEHLLSAMKLAPEHRVLDIGCGLGGTCRLLAQRQTVAVTGIDLTASYVEAGQALNTWVGLNEAIELIHGNALDLPFAENTFDRVTMLHVGMNIEDKVSLFEQIHHVLKPGGMVGIYDIMRLSQGELNYPVPWASDASQSHLCDSDDYLRLIDHADLDAKTPENRAAFAKTFFAQMKAAAGQRATDKQPTPPGLQFLMGPEVGLKVKNMAAGVAAGVIAPVQLLAGKPL